MRGALKEHASALEEGKADILGLYMVSALMDAGELDGDIRDNMVTFLAGIFRSVRFGASSAHGRANMIRFNYFLEMGAFSRDAETGMYSADYDKMIEAMNALTEKILRFQGDGDYEGVAAFVADYARVPQQSQADLDRWPRRVSQSISYLNRDWPQWGVDHAMRFYTPCLIAVAILFHGLRAGPGPARTRAAISNPGDDDRGSPGRMGCHGFLIDTDADHAG